MNTSIRASLALLLFALAMPSQAAIRVLATTADWGALTTELGGERVDVYTATSAMQDVHRVEAKPSLVARARTADLLVANGAELDIGWLPILLQESGTRKIRRNAPGACEATSAVTRVEKPVTASLANCNIRWSGYLVEPANRLSRS
jgi:zinc/manganese transport system substrate-binding protein